MSKEEQRKFLSSRRLTEKERKNWPRLLKRKKEYSTLAEIASNNFYFYNEPFVGGREARISIHLGKPSKRRQLESFMQASQLLTEPNRHPSTGPGERRRSFLLKRPPFLWSKSLQSQVLDRQLGFGP